MMPPVFPLLIGSDAVTAILGLNPTKAFRSGDAPQGTVAPYLTWSVITDVPANVMDGPAGIENMRVQVDCYTVTGTDCDTLADAVRDALEDGGQNVMLSQNIDGVDPTTRLYRNSRDYSFWVTRSS